MIVILLFLLTSSSVHGDVSVSGPTQIDGTDLVYADKLIPRPTIIVTFTNSSWKTICQADGDFAETVIRLALNGNMTNAVMSDIRATTEVTQVEQTLSEVRVTVTMGWCKDFYIEPKKLASLSLFLDDRVVWYAVVTAPVVASPATTWAFDILMGSVFGMSLFLHRSTSITLQTLLVVISLPSASIAARRLALHSTWVMSPFYAMFGPMGKISQYTSGGLWNLLLVFLAGGADLILDRVFKRTLFPSITIQVSAVYLQPTLFFAVSQLTRPIKNQGNLVVVLVFVALAILLCIFGYFLRNIFASLDTRKHWRATTKPDALIEYRGEWLPSEFAEKFGSIFMPYVPPYHQYFFGVGLFVGCTLAVSAATVRLYGTSVALVVLVGYGLLFAYFQPTRSRALSFFKGGCYVFMAVVPAVQIAISMGSVQPLQTPIATSGTIIVVPLLAMFELAIVAYLKWSWWSTEIRPFTQPQAPMPPFQQQVVYTQYPQQPYVQPSMYPHQQQYPPGIQQQPFQQQPYQQQPYQQQPYQQQPQRRAHYLREQRRRRHDSFIDNTSDVYWNCENPLRGNKLVSEPSDPMFTLEGGARMANEMNSFVKDITTGGGGSGSGIGGNRRGSNDDGDGASLFALGGLAGGNASAGGGGNNMEVGGGGASGGGGGGNANSEENCCGDCCNKCDCGDCDCCSKCDCDCKCGDVCGACGDCDCDCD
eukprot:PhF_6_TR2204/c0_g1_i2/m.3667